MNLDEYLAASGRTWKNKWFQEKEDELQHFFDFLSNYILELHIGENICLSEVYTSQVYPRTLRLQGKDYVLWDNHFWRLFAHFVNLFFLYQEDFSNESYIMYLKSLQLLFLSSRFDKFPAFSRFIAEEYKRLEYKIPAHNKRDDIINVLKYNGHFEEFNIGRIFGYCHEIAHIAIKRDNTLAWTVKNMVVDYCNFIINTCEINKKLNHLLDEEESKEKVKNLDLISSIAKQIYDNEDGAIQEEVCCDIIALYVILTYLEIQGKSKYQIANSLGYIDLFFLFLWWLVSNEHFWDMLRKVYENPIANDDAFVNENSPYYDFEDKISIIRNNFTFFFFSNYSKIPINHIQENTNLKFKEFVSILDKANGYDVLDRVLFKYSVSKKDYNSKISHWNKRNKIVGW